jgi:hypothetical protein
LGTFKNTFLEDKNIGAHLEHSVVMQRSKNEEHLLEVKNKRAHIEEDKSE